MTHYDFIVVGSGSVGSAAGCYARLAGLSVLMIDSAIPPHEQGSHHGDTRLIRHAYDEGEKYVPLILRAQTLWDALQQHTELPLFQRTGVINVGPERSEFLANMRHSAQRWSIPLESMTASDIAQRWPALRIPDDYEALFEPNAGVLKSENAVATWVKLARDAGCAQLFNCAVSAIHYQDGNIQVDTADGSFTAGRLLVSAGTWVTRLIPSLPVSPVRKVFGWFQADGRYSADNGFPAFTGELPDGNQFYGFPATDNALKIGKHNGGQPITAPEERTPFGSEAGDGSECFAFLRQFLPGIGGCLYGASCTYDNSPDEDFIIDTLPENPDVMVVTGLSGHGFKFAPVLGEIASLFAQGKSSTFDLSPFRLNRFKAEEER